MRKLAPITTIGILLTASGFAAAEETSEERVDPDETGILPPAEEAESPGVDEELQPEEVREDRREAKNSVYLELAGPGLFYSVNYDRVITDDFSARIGFSYLSLGASAGSGDTTASAEASYWAVPLMANYIGLSSGTHSLELGVGGSLMNASGDVGVGDESAEGSVTLFAFTGLVGYRRQALRGGFNFRIGFSPMFFTDGYLLPTGYMSFGASF